MNIIQAVGFGDVAELVECARLEIVYTGNRIGGSNPSISARVQPHHRWDILFGIKLLVVGVFFMCGIIIPC